MRAMANLRTDRDVVKAIGAAVLIEHGYSAWAVRKWMQRGIPWHARAKVERIAREQRVKLPATFREERAAA